MSQPSLGIWGVSVSTDWSRGSWRAPGWVLHSSHIVPREYGGHTGVTPTLPHSLSPQVLELEGCQVRFLVSPECQECQE